MGYATAGDPKYIKSVFGLPSKTPFITASIAIEART